MTDAEIQALMLRELGNIAPEVKLDEVDPTVDLREQLDLDSMDMLNWIIALHEATGVEIPEADYAHLANLKSGVAYLRDRIK
jgi:acyl carrier protein